MSIAVVTIAHHRGAHLRRQHQGLLASLQLPEHYVVVAIDDPSIGEWHPPGTLRPHVVDVPTTDQGLPLAAARNAGAAAALGLGADLLIFLDVDCIPGPGLVGAYASARQHASTRWDLFCGPVAYLPPAPDGGHDLDLLGSLAEPHPSRPAPAPDQVEIDRDGHDLFWSLSFALGQETWEAVGGFDEAYVGYGAEDTDFGRRAAYQDIPIAWVGGARAFHQHHPVSTPPVEHLDDIVRNGRLFAQRWGRWPMRGWLEKFVEMGLVERTDDGYQRVETRVLR